MPDSLPGPPMISEVVDLLRCPHCASELTCTDRVVSCAGPHRFDLARQGQLNLLSNAAPANADTAEMVAARLDHLGHGFHDQVRDLLTTRAGRVVLDAGCGPGWYLAGLSDDHRAIGLDLSAAAARRAARLPRTGIVVTDLRRGWPVADRSVDTVWSIFAPRNRSETARVLRPGGELVVVLPAPDHLDELRAAGAVIGLQPDKEQTIAEQFADWQPIRRDTVRVEIERPDPAFVATAVAMGPSAHHRTTTATVDRLTLSLVVRAFRPEGEPA